MSKVNELYETRRRAAAAYLEHASQRQNEARASTDKEHGGHIKAKGNSSVGKEDEGADASDLEERRKALCEWEDGEVDECAHGRVIMQRYKGIHLEAVEQDLDHHQTRSFELVWHQVSLERVPR